MADDMLYGSAQRADTVIRPAGEGDIDSLHVIDTASFGDAWTRDGLEAELYKQDNAFLCAECGDVPVGFICAQNVSGEVFISKIAVASEHRSKGIGRALLREVIRTAEHEKCELVTLEVRVSNTAAERLYASEGFESVGVRPRFYEKPLEDALIMTLYISGEISE